MAESPPPPEQIVLAHFIVSDDVERSRRFYSEVLGGRVVFSFGELTYVALSNSWIIINVGGGPTDDKPAVTLETPRDPDRVSSFINIRVKDMEAVYSEWSARGAHFLTSPKQHQHEIRCYIRTRVRHYFLSVRHPQPQRVSFGTISVATLTPKLTPTWLLDLDRAQLTQQESPARRVSKRVSRHALP